MVSLRIQEIDVDKIVLHPTDGSVLGVEMGEIVTITEPNSGKKTVGLVSIRQEVSNGNVGMNRTLFESIGMEEGFNVEVLPYKKPLVPIESVELGLEPDKDMKIRKEDALMKVKTNEKGLLKFVGNQIFTINSKFNWNEYGLVVTIKNTRPPLGIDDVARFGELKDFTYSWIGSEVKSFDGELLIDVSGSMKTRDMPFQDMESTINRMEAEFTGDSAQQFFNVLKGSGNYVKRYEGAAMCALMYLVEKIGRGVGDNISVILFSDQAVTIPFGEQPYYNSKFGDSIDAGETILYEIDKLWHGMTNLEQALVNAIDNAKSFDRSRMKMFVILTDGKVDNEEQTKELLRKRLIPRADIIINTLGLGPKVNDEFLDWLARSTGGQYHKVWGLKELLKIYSNYALNLEIRGSDAAVESWVEEESEVAGPLASLPTAEMPTSENIPKEIPRCTSCSEPLAFISKYSSWYCNKCGTYDQDVKVEDVPQCSSCKEYLSYIPQYEKWYCYECEKYA
jgi:predicted RNA-binding Zn-ribbon protein involved in translation (DUF1610 family)